MLLPQGKYEAMYQIYDPNCTKISKSVRIAIPKYTENKVSTIELKKITVVSLLFSSKALLNCRLKPRRNPVPSIERMFPRVIDKAYLVGLPVMIPSIDPIETTSIVMLRPKQTQNAIRRSLKLKAGRQLSSESSLMLLLS